MTLQERRNSAKLLQNVYTTRSRNDLTNRDLIDRNDKKDDDNLQKLRKRINKLSKKVIDKAKPENGPIDILDKLKRIRLERDAKLIGDESILKRKNQIDKNSSSSSSTHSMDFNKSRNKDILRLIKEKEAAASSRFGGDESDVETDFSENHFNKNKHKNKKDGPTLVDLASSLHKIHSKYSASSVPMGANSRRIAKSVLTKSAKPIDVKITSKYSIRSSLANIFGGSIDNEQNKPNPISVPDYLEQFKNAKKNKKKTRVKKVNKKDGGSGEVKLQLSASRSKLMEDVKPLKGGIKKDSSGKKKKKKEHVLFTETPEVINGPKESKEDKKKKKKVKIRKKSPSIENKENNVLPKSVQNEYSKTLNYHYTQYQQQNQLNQFNQMNKLNQMNHQMNNQINNQLNVSSYMENRVLSTPTSRTSTSMMSAKDARLKIQKNNANTLMNLNGDMSTTLQESIAHMNDICMKVRSTLGDMERDQIKYNTSRQKKNVDLNEREGVEADFSIISIHESSQNNQKKNVEQKNVVAKKKIVDQPKSEVKKKVEVKNVEKKSSKVFTTVVKTIKEDNALDRILTSISMQGDEIVAEKAKSDKHIEIKQRKKSSKIIQETVKVKNHEDEVQELVEKAISVEPTQPPMRRSYQRIPIWERKPPSVINDIQLMVKRQATRSQYKEFMRNLRRQKRSKSDSQSANLTPKEINANTLDSQTQIQAPIKPTNKVLMENNPKVEETKKCNSCASEKCTCGVVVENVGLNQNNQNNWMNKTRTPRRGILAYDILDEITLKDVEPLQSEYPRKDHIFSDDSNTKVEDTLLYRLLYNESPRVLESLLKTDTGSKTSLKPTKPKPISSFSRPISSGKESRSPNLVSKAYQMYEKLELGGDQKNVDLDARIPPPPINHSVKNVLDKINKSKKTAKRSQINLTLNSPQILPKIVPKVKQRALQNCPKEFNDEVNIPKDLVDLKKKASKKYCIVSLKTDLDLGDGEKRKSGKSDSDKKKKQKKVANKKMVKPKKKDFIKPKIKNYLMDPTNINFKNILTVMRVKIDLNKNVSSLVNRNFKENFTIFDENRKEINQDLKNLMISEENREKIGGMTRKEIIKTLTPYIFLDFQPKPIIVMPVFAKYNNPNTPRYQNQSQKDRKLISFREQDEYQRFYNRCQEMEMLIHNPHPHLNQIHLNNSLNQNKNVSKFVMKKNAMIEDRNAKSHLIKTGGRSNLNLPQFQINSKRSVNKDAAIMTRRKLNEVKALVNQNKDYFPKNLNKAIDGIENKIINVLSHPASKHNEAFVEIEEEIRSILTNIGMGEQKIASNSVENKKIGFGKRDLEEKTKRLQINSPKFTVRNKNLQSPITKVNVKCNNLNALKENNNKKDVDKKDVDKKDVDKKEIFKNIDKKDIKKKEIDGKDFDRKEIDVKKIDGKEIDGKKIDGKGIDGKKIDGKEIDRKEIDKKEIDIKKFDKKEIDKKEIDKKEIDNKEIDRNEINKKVITKKELNKPETRKDLNDDIDKAIQGLDALMNVGSSDVSRIDSNPISDVSLTESQTTPLNEINTFCARVDQVIEQINLESPTKNVNEENEVTISQQQSDEEEDKADKLLSFKSDDFLTPYMKAVKDYRKSEGNESLMEFLNKLSNLSSQEIDKIDVEAKKSVKNLAVEIENEKIEDEILNINHSCQATGLQNDSVQVDFDSISEDDVKFKDQKVGESSTDFIPLEIDEIFITKDTQTTPTSEIFNEVEEYIKNIHEKEILNQTISKEETLLRENERQEALKQDILKLKLETNQNRSSSIISFKEEDEEYEDSFEKLEENQEKEIQTQQQELIVENQQTQTNNLIKTINENVQVTIRNELKDTAINTTQKDLTINMFSAEICEPKPILKTVSIETIKTGVSKSVETNFLIRNVESLETCSDTNPNQTQISPSVDLISIFDSNKHQSLSQSVQVDSENINKNDENDKNEENDKNKENDKNDVNKEKNDTNFEVINKDGGEKDDEEKDENYKDGVLSKLIAEENEDCRYGILLNSLYGLLFTIVFLGLNMDYSC